MIKETGNVPSVDKKVGQIEIAVNNLGDVILESQSLVDQLNARLDLVLDRSPEVANGKENEKRPPIAPLAESIASLYDRVVAINSGLSYLIRKIEI